MAKQSKGIPDRAIITDEVRKFADLTADPRNAKQHSESQISQISASIEQFGYINCVVIQPNNQIIGGHVTLEAARDARDARRQRRAPRRPLSRIDDGAVFFSGEALYRGRDMSTVEAALANGLATARTLLG